MVLVSRVRIAVGLLLLGLPLLAGCAETIETGPAVEPSVGPGVGAGGSAAETKAPSFGPAAKADKPTSEKPAEKK